MAQKHRHIWDVLQAAGASSRACIGVGIGERCPSAAPAAPGENRCSGCSASYVQRRAAGEVLQMMTLSSTPTDAELRHAGRFAELALRHRR